MNADQLAVETRRTRAPRVTQKVMGKNTPHLKTAIGSSKTRPDFVEVNVEPVNPRKEPELAGTFFLGVTLGTVNFDGQPGFTELDGCIHPNQLDDLIACLTKAAAEGRARGLIPRITRGGTAGGIR